MGNYLPMSWKNIQIGQLYVCQYIPACANLLLDKLLANHGPKCTHYIVKMYIYTCVNSGIEISLSLQCKILQYKIFQQLSMEVQDFFSLCKIYHPAWIQVDRRNVEQSEL